MKRNIVGGPLSSILCDGAIDIVWPFDESPDAEVCQVTAELVDPTVVDIVPVHLIDVTGDWCVAF